MEYYASDYSTVTWVGSLFNGLMLMFGPIIGGLANKFGLRPICMSGSIIACIGLCLSIISPNVQLLMITIGIVGGLGAGMISLPANIAIGYYFESKRALATGISMCGSGVGQFVFAPLITFLLNVYGWKIAIFIIGGLCLVCIFFGALIRPLELKNNKDNQSHPVSFFKFLSRNEKPEQIIQPYSRKDSFFIGSPEKLMRSNDSTSTWNDFRHLLALTPKYVCFFDNLL